MTRFGRLMESLANRAALVAVLGFLLLAVIVLIDAALGLAGGSPIVGMNEIVAILISIGVAACIPAGLSRAVHLRVDVLQRWLSPTTNRGLEIIASSFSLLFIAAMAISFGAYAFTVWRRGQITPIVGLPLSYFYGFVALCFALGALVQTVAVFGRRRHMTVKSGAAAGWADRTFLICILVAVILVAVVFSTTTPHDLLTMSPGMVALTFIALSWLLILGFVPIGAVLGLCGIAGTALIVGRDAAVYSAGLELTPYLESEQFAVLPLFLLMGSLAAVSGLAADVYKLAYLLLRRVRGGLAIATILGCAGFGAVTGSSVATLATLGRVALPEMRRRGYSDALATGSLAAGGTLGMLIPPSGVLILYALLTEVSIGRMFMAAIVPVALSVVLYCAVVVAFTVLKPDAAPSADAAVVEDLRGSIIGTAMVATLVGIVLGGLYGGFVTVLQSAALGVVVTAIFAILRGALGGGRFWEVLAQTISSTAMIYLLIFGGMIFSFFIGVTGVVETLAAQVSALQLTPLALTLVLIVIYLILGTVIDPIASLVITAPVVAPLVLANGFDLAWWGVIMIVVVETGMLHPPLGLNVFILKGVAGDDVRLSTIFRGVIPFVAIDLFKLALLIAFPALVLWLPAHMR
jgi:tripartite ATP-independent transporter DctM subunit